MSISSSKPDAPPRNNTWAIRDRAALALLNSVALLPPLAAAAHRRIGLVHARGGRPAKAIASFEAALAAGLATRGDIHHQLGLALLATDQPIAAEQTFRRAIDAAPRACWSYQGLGQALAAQGRTAEAEGELRRGLQACPGHGWLGYHLAQALVSQRRMDDALDVLIAIGTAGGADPPPRLPSPPSFVRKDLATPARIAGLRVVAERFPDHIDYLFLLTRLLSLRGDYAAATDALEAFWRRHWGYTEPRPDPMARPTRPTLAFLIVGQGKAGTTSLYAYVCQHKQILPAIWKEVRYWSDFATAGLDWYREHFPPIRYDSGLITGEASPQYLIHPETPQWIARDFPNIKLILLLREPVNCAYASYRMHERLGIERRSWRQVVDHELAQTPVCPLGPEDLPALSANEVAGAPYLLRRAALPFLRRWLEHFPPEQFLVLRHDDLRRNTSGTVRQVYRFLGLPDFVPDTTEMHNAGRYPPMAPAIEQRLRDWFAPHQQALGELLVSLGSVAPGDRKGP
jgi:tetratricopeptide (TPR) repeat protein